MSPTSQPQPLPPARSLETTTCHSISLQIPPQPQPFCLETNTDVSMQPVESVSRAPEPPQMKLENNQNALTRTPPLDTTSEICTSPAHTEPLTPLSELSLSSPATNIRSNCGTVCEPKQQVRFTKRTPNYGTDSASSSAEQSRERLSSEKVQAEFVFADGAKFKTVKLAGSWNGWIPIAMYREGKAGIWSVATKVPVGLHHFKFIVDNEWVISQRHPHDTDKKHNIRVIESPKPRSRPLKAPVQTISRNSGHILSWSPTCCSIV